VTSGRATRDNRQAKVAVMRAQAAKAEARRRSMIVGTAIIAVIIVIVAAFVLVQHSRHNSETAKGPTPANLAADNSIVVGKASAPVTITAYEDFQCPTCLQFEQQNATQIAAWVKAGTVKVEYRPVAILDRSSSTNYSTRSLNAAAALIDTDPSAFQAFHDALYANQPAEGTAGLTNAKLIDLAVSAGASKAAITAAVDSETYKGWTIRVTDAASKAGLTGTPWVKVNNQVIQQPTPTNLTAAVDAAAKKK
jgi:protein-disulfide isomerase